MTESNKLALSVLDVAPIVDGGTVRDALLQSIDLVRHVEKLGYLRHWVAEHHSLSGVGSSATSVLIAHLADATSTIRVGSGGVMLPNHAPLVIAEQFGTLEALHPGRIDLGLGRAPGSEPVTARALRRNLSQSGEDMAELVAELIAFFDGTFPDNHPYKAITAIPGLGHKPEIWLLGSSGYSAKLAGLMGLPFGFAHHFSAQNTEAAIELYRRNFTPSATLAEPYVVVTMMAMCAPTDEEAHDLAAPDGLSFLRRRTRQRAQLSTVKEAIEYPYDSLERELIRERHATQAVGSPTTVHRRFDEIVESTGADEIMVITTTYEHEDRLRSYELIAKEMDLAPLTA